MGEAEKEVAKRVRTTKMRLAILSTIQGTGLIATALVAPNVAALMAKHMNRSHINSTRNALQRLKHAGLITVHQGQASLTGKGAHYLSLQLSSRPKPRHWDRKWRVVIFDVPESRRKVRDRLRMMLTSVGFLKLQDSVWVYPYDSEDIVTLIKTELHAGKSALYMIVDRIEDDGWIRRHFDLK